MKILVTGGLGFQGSHLVRRLISEWHEVTVLATPSDISKERELSFRRHLNAMPRRNALEIIWGSVTDMNLVHLAVEKADLVVHMAAWANPDKCTERPVEATRVNIYGTQVVLQAIRHVRDGAGRAVPLIHVSSCEVYGSAFAGPQDEHAPMIPPSIYAASKCGADRLANAYAVSYNLPVTIVRPCNVFGPGQRSGPHGGVIPTFVYRARHRQSLVVRGGLQSREFIYIDDLVQAYHEIISEKPEAWRRVLNIGTGQRVSIKAIAEFISRHFKGTQIEWALPRAGDVDRFELDSSLFRKTFGERKFIDFFEGLHKYIVWALAEQA